MRKISAILVTLLFAFCGYLQATNFTVNVTTDTQDSNPGNGVCSDPGGNCSLRAAIMEANALPGQDTIFLPAGTYTMTKTGINENGAFTGDLDINSNIVIVGADTRTTIVNMDSLDRVFDVRTGGVAYFTGFEIRAGYVQGAHGGGIQNVASLTMVDVALKFSATVGNVGGTVTAGGFGGGIWNSGTLTLNKVTFEDNKAIGSRGQDGGVPGAGGAGGGGAGLGGAIFNENGGTITLTNVTFAANEARGGGGGFGSTNMGSFSAAGGNGGGLNGQGGVTNGGAGQPGGFGGGGGGGGSNATTPGNGGAGGYGGGGGSRGARTAGNTGGTVGPGGFAGGNGGGGCCSASGGGGGGGGLGGALFNNGGTVTAMNITAALNKATGGAGGGGGFGGGGASGQGHGAGFFNRTGTVNLSNSILALNTSSSSTNPDAYGTFTSSQGHNLVGNPGVAVLGGTTTGNLTNLSPGMGPFGNYGGNTDVFSLILCPTSPAIDAGTATGAPAKDQRDTARVAQTDIGAYEAPAPAQYNPFTTADTSICMGDTVVLDAGAGYTSYNWSNGSMAQITDTDQPGMISVTVIDINACTLKDSILVVWYPNPVVSLGPDLDSCTNGSLLLDPGSQFVTYQWQDNSTSQTFTAGATGTYYVTITDTHGCLGADTVNVTLHALPTPDLGPDQVVCFGASATLDAGMGYQNYAWTDALGNPVFNQQIFITPNTGTYLVTVTDSNGCMGSDSAAVTVSAFIAGNFLGPDSVSFCQGDSVTLNAGSQFMTYTWLDTINGDSLFTVTSEGSVFVEVIDSLGCFQTDTVYVTELMVPVLELGPAQVICPGEQAELLPSNASQWDSLLWQDSSKVTQYITSDTGWYSVTAWFLGCQVSDTVRVDSCPSYLQVIPNVFTPNGDGFNDFLDYKGMNFEIFQLVIFDRWGKQVFETKSHGTFWNGKIGAADAKEGVYYYVLRYKLATWQPSELEEESGHITLLR
ncbi:MAG: gliding motility-associated C-terminal domain-containing protein [Bacteroidia bacterium]|nr:gliding motility-associated C-terminal domain-containing protein [Bacteroidia bacterium]